MRWLTLRGVEFFEHKIEYLSENISFCKTIYQGQKGSIHEEKYVKNSSDTAILNSARVQVECKLSEWKEVKGY